MPALPTVFPAVQQEKENRMTYGWIVPFLFMFTLLAVCVFALVSKKNTEDRIDDPNVPKSTLAKDGPQGGVAFLMPLDQQRQRGRDAAPVLE